MIILDTHIWIWWVHGDKRLTEKQKIFIQENEGKGLGVSAISCWEVAKLATLNRIELPFVINEWMQQALSYPGVTLLDLTPSIILDSVQLPGSFHRDPADQIIVATARMHESILVTSDTKIINYPYVKTL